MKSFLELVFVGLLIAMCFILIESVARYVRDVDSRLDALERGEVFTPSCERGAIQIQCW